MFGTMRRSPEALTRKAGVRLRVGPSGMCRVANFTVCCAVCVCSQQLPAGVEPLWHAAADDSKITEAATVLSVSVKNVWCTCKQAWLNERGACC